MKIYKEYYVSVKHDGDLAYVLPLSGGKNVDVARKHVKLRKLFFKGEGYVRSV